MELWFRRKYSLAPTDPRYLDMTVEAIEVEYWANIYADRRATGRGDEIEDEDEDFDLEEVLRQNAAEADDLPDDFEDVPS